MKVVITRHGSFVTPRFTVIYFCTVQDFCGLFYGSTLLVTNGEITIPHLYVSVFVSSVPKPTPAKLSLEDPSEVFACPCQNEVIKDSISS